MQIYLCSFRYRQWHGTVRHIAANYVSFACLSGWINLKSDFNQLNLHQTQLPVAHSFAPEKNNINLCLSTGKKMQRKKCLFEIKRSAKYRQMINPYKSAPETIILWHRGLKKCEYEKPSTNHYNRIAQFFPPYAMDSKCPTYCMALSLFCLFLSRFFLLSSIIRVSVHNITLIVNTRFKFMNFS